MDTRQIDAACMLRIANGDNDAIGELIDRWGGVLRRWFRSHGAVRGTAEDLAQEVFIRIWRRASQYIPGQAVAPWIIQIARNILIDQYRAESRRNRRLVMIHCDAALESVEELADSHAADELREAALQSLANASDGYREVVEDVLSGKSLAQHAERCGIAEVTARWRWCQAIAKLKSSHEFTSNFAPVNV